MTQSSDPQKVLKTDPAKWVDLYGDYLYRYALLRVSDHHLAEDLVQETFLAALNARGSFRGESRERTWFIGILKRKIIDYYRKKRTAETLKPDEEMDRLQDFETQGAQRGRWKMGRTPREWNGSPEQWVEDRQFMNVLEQCFRKLPEKYFGIFVLREIDAYASKEICKLFSISQSNLWVILHRARRLLRRCLEMHWLGKEDAQAEPRGV